MNENYELVQRGFRILVGPLSNFVGNVMKSRYGGKWWTYVKEDVTFPEQKPATGSFEELTASLDVADCFRIIDINWKDAFRSYLDFNCRSWAKELQTTRNEVSHIGQSDIDQHKAERALDTMALLCNYIDSKATAQIREIYKEARSRAGDAPTITFTGVAQPDTISARGELKKGSLLHKVDTDAVRRTQLTRKVTYGGKTEVYPVYQVRLDQLYYNDQNDRIATWISRYEAENGEGTLSSLDTKGFNDIIESFIVDSNPDAITRTQKNIELVGQREPGVTLADGRIVDGNRRFTCLRRIQEGTSEPLYFETVIMDVDIHEDKKQIKLLELAIQHGEEKKVDYDLIDYAIGTYRDTEVTGLLTVEEYAHSANESVAEVRKRISIAKMVSEFLEYIKLPEQYYVAREYQVYSLFQEMMAPLKQLDDSDKEQLKTIVFNNTMMKAVPDQRKFIRDIKGLVKNDSYRGYFDDQKILADELREEYSQVEVRSKFDVDKFAEDNKTIAEEMQQSMENALQSTRAKVLKAKPAENITKSVALLNEIDTKLFSKLQRKDKAEILDGLDELSQIIEYIRNQIDEH